MNLTGYKTFTIKKTVPPRYLFGQLRKLGLNQGQIFGLVSGRKIPDLMNVLNDVMKAEGNKSKLFCEWVGALPREKKKRQLKLRGL